MLKLLHIGLIISAVVAVAVADVLLKKAAAMNSWQFTWQSPWLFLAVLLYLYQIFFFTHIFMTGGALSYVGSMQTVLYALVVVGAGVLIYGETLNGVQMAGVALAVMGAVLLNLG